MTQHIVDCFLWAVETLHHKGYQVRLPFCEVCHPPWSCVFYIATTQGKVYLKIMPELFQIEPVLMRFLSSQGGQSVLPQIIAVHPDGGCFLMEDAGGSVRARLQGIYDAPTFAHILQLYGSLQIKAIPHVSTLLSMGVRDCRLEKLPDLYCACMEDTATLRSYGLSTSMIDALQSLYDTFVRGCQILAQYGLPDTIEHGDIHDNNILCIADRYVINDWADVSIAPPFFSLAGWINATKRVYGADLSTRREARLQAAYFDNWKTYGAPSVLQSAFLWANRLRPLHYVINYQRLIACDPKQVPPHKVVEALQMLIEQLRAAS